MSPVAGLVLAGGRSSRMGQAKATLEWQGRPLVEHIAMTLDMAVDGPVVVVHAPGQALPTLPAGIEFAVDAAEGRGPLEGIAAGLRAVHGRAGAAFVSSTDVPFLHPAFVRRIVAALDETVDAVVPRDGERTYPLSAVYRVALLTVAEDLLAADRLRASLLAERARTRYLDVSTLLDDPVLAAADPGLRSLADVNDPGSYDRARAEA